MGNVFAIRRRTSGRIARRLKDASLRVLEDRTDGLVDDPLTRARMRGRRFAQDAYAHADTLTLVRASDYARLDAAAILRRHEEGGLYALPDPEKAQERRYPKWQFDAEPSRLGAVLRLFISAGTNVWVLHAFMIRERDVLDGRSPAEVVVDTNLSVRPVIELAMRELNAGQGPS
ncbi:hypothetical protein [Paraburkholderia sp. GAS42]|jgi:hypothetical protein|uniref:hypothetical protein n=1 Tax=Paraburkholderia sp. GAS42 TaxID=3035135 RepID=UPI003D23AA28